MEDAEEEHLAVRGSGGSAAAGRPQSLLSSGRVRFGQSQPQPKALGCEKDTVAASAAFVQPPAQKCDRCVYVNVAETHRMSWSCS